MTNHAMMHHDQPNPRAFYRNGKSYVILLLHLIFLFTVSTVGVLGNSVFADPDSMQSRYDKEIALRPLTTKIILEGILAKGISERDTAMIIQAQLLIVACYEQLKQFREGLDLLHSIDALPEAQTSIFQYQIDRRYAGIYLQSGDFAKANVHLDLCLSIADEMKDEQKIGNLLLFKSVSFINQGKLESAISLIDSAHQIFIRSGDQKGFQTVHATMGTYYDARGQKDKSIEASKKALDLAIRLKDTAAIVVARSNLLSEYAIGNNLAAAKEQYNQWVILLNHLDGPINKSTEVNYGIALTNHSKFAEGLRVLKDCQVYFSETQDFRRKVFTHHWMAIANRGLDRYDVAADQSKMGYELAVEKGYDKLSEISAYTLFQTYHWRDQHKKAIEWLIKFSEHKAALVSKSQQEEMLDLETKYETLRKEQEIEILQAQNRADGIKRKILLTSVLLSMIIAVLMIQHQISKRRKDQMIHYQERKIQMAKEANLQQALNYKQRELGNKVLQLAKKNQFLAELEAEVKNLSSKVDLALAKTTNRIRKMLSYDQLEKQDWKQFVQEFNTAHPDFTRKLRLQYGSFTHSEMRLITLLRMNLSSKEMANILRISDQSIWKSRYRLRKKMGLDGPVDLQEMILGI